MSAFDRDFGRDFGKVEETVLLDGVAGKLNNRFPRGDAELAKEHRLLVIDPTGQEWEFPVRGEIMIGRSEENQIALEDRAVSRHHLAINTDGKLFWYQDLNSGNGTQVNGEFVSEGWLTGGEEIVVGNSRIYFLVPEIQAPPELDDFERKLEEKKKAEEEAAARAAEAAAARTAAAREAAAPPDAANKSGSSLGIVIFLFSLVVVAGVVVWGYREFKKPTEKKLTPLEVAVQQFNDGKRLMKEQKWPEADQMLRQAASTAEDTPVRSDILRYVRIVGKELSAYNMLKRARSLYIDEDKAKDALALLDNISPETEAFADARKLKRRIFKKEVDPKLAAAKLALSAQKVPEATELVASVLKLDAKHTEALELQKQISSGNLPASPTKVEETPPPTRRKGRSSRSGRRSRSGSTDFSQGFQLYRNGQYSQAIIFFRRQESSASSRSDRKKAKSYRTAVDDFQRSLRSGLSASSASSKISSLQRAQRADKILNGGQKQRYARPLAMALYQRGQSAQSSKRSMDAFRDYKAASQLDPTNAKIQAALQSLRKNAKDWFEQAQALKDIDNNEAKRLLMQVMRLLPPSDPLHQKAKGLLN